MHQYQKGRTVGLTELFAAAQKANSYVICPSAKDQIDLSSYEDRGNIPGSPSYLCGFVDNKWETLRCYPMNYKAHKYNEFYSSKYTDYKF